MKASYDSDMDGDYPQTNLRKLNQSGHVGFDSLPDQLVTKATQKGFNFNVLCVGETGIGKSTLMSTLFNSNNFDMEQQGHASPKVSLKSSEYELTESGVTLNLTVLETLGYGDQINKEDSYRFTSKIEQTFFKKYSIFFLNIFACSSSRIYR